MAVEYDPALIGRIFEQTDPVPVTPEMVKNFTAAIGETNPIYLDPEAAKKGPNGTVVAPPSFAVTFRNGQHFFQHVPRFVNLLDVGRRVRRADQARRRDHARVLRQGDLR